MRTRAAAPSRSDVGALRRALGVAGYDEKRLRGALALRGRFVAPSAGRHGLYLQRVGEHGALSTLTRLFLLETPVPGERAAEALAPLGLDGAEALGLVRTEGASVVPLVRIAPHDGLFIVSDSGDWDGADKPEDFVPGLSGAGVTVANLTPRVQVADALDLGAGSGLHALLAARNADRVVATDINARALEFADLNAQLNGFANLELRK